MLDQNDGADKRIRRVTSDIVMYKPRYPICLDKCACGHFLI